MAVNTSPWLVDALPDRCRTVVRLGSSTEYAASPAPLTEQAALEPRGFFGATKAAGSLLLQAAAAERGVRAVVLRAFQVYGPGDHPTRLVPVVLEAARTGGAVALPAHGSAGGTGCGSATWWTPACAPPRGRPAAGRRAQHRDRRADQHRGARGHRGPGDRPADRHGARRASGPRLGHRRLGLRPDRRPAAAGVGADRRPGRGAGPHLGARRDPAVAVVVPVYGNAATLRPLAERLAAALDGRDWRLRLVIDASPDGSAAVAAALAAEDPRIAVTVLDGQRRPARRARPRAGRRGRRRRLGLPGRRPPGPAGGRAAAARPAGPR